jgi:endogenous inhibitor of DNA gyrase (YacG/DUF329 family)
MAMATDPNAKPCAICRKPVVDRYKPFCSKRCADVDLNRWLSGSYVIPGSELLPEDDEELRPARPAKDDD